MAIALSDIINASASRAGLSQEFAEGFRQRMLNSPKALDAYVCYLKTGIFSEDYKVSGLSISDILIYQLDHFKAWLDKDRQDMKHNQDLMILKAFDTMLEMEKEPALAKRIKNAFTSESGTDIANHDYLHTTANG